MRRLLSLATVILLMPVAAAEAAPAADGCAGNVPGLAAYTPVLGIDLPEQAHWLGQAAPYSFDRTAEVAGGFDRVGYCLELDGPNGSQWVWTAMEPFTTDASRLGLPTMPGQLTRQRVGDLEVRSNVAGVTTGTGQTGYLELWPNQYGTTTSGCNNLSVNLRDAQRRMADTLGITVLSTNGLSGHDGCHYAWLDGYRELGDHTYAVLARDLYGGPSAGVAPPNPLSAAYSKADRTEITVQLRSADPLTVDPGTGATFRVDGSAATVRSVAYAPGGKLVLTLSAPADGATGLSYLGNLRAGPWITNTTGTGLLAFTGVTIS